MVVRLIVEVVDKVKCWAYQGAIVQCIKSDSFEHMANYIAGVYKDYNILINKAGFGVALGKELEKLGCDFSYMGQEHTVTVEEVIESYRTQNLKNYLEKVLSSPTSFQNFKNKFSRNLPRHFLFSL